jgi:SAM-dependent methyltransferase
MIAHSQLAESNQTAGIRMPAQSACPACRAAVSAKGVEIADQEYGVDYVALYVECQDCGTIFQKPMPTMNELAEFYPSDYHSMTHAGLLNRVRNQMRIRRLAKLMAGQGAILDYGCGDGAFLVQAAESMPHRRFWGFEISSRAETIALAGGAVTIIKGDLPDLLAVLPACSLITLNHVIEHLPDPAAVVTALAGRLLPGGIFEGQTPAADSLERFVFGRRWSGYHAPRHTVVFSRKGLCRMLERCGLSDAATEGAFNPAGLAVSVGSLFHGESGGHIRRSGLKWLCMVATGASLGPIDLLSGRPGIVNFSACKR